MMPAWLLGGRPLGTRGAASAQSAPAVSSICSALPQLDEGVDRHAAAAAGVDKVKGYWGLLWGAAAADGGRPSVRRGQGSRVLRASIG